MVALNKKETVCSEKNIYPPDYFICFILLFCLFYFIILFQWAQCELCIVLFFIWTVLEILLS